MQSETITNVLNSIHNSFRGVLDTTICNNVCLYLWKAIVLTPVSSYCKTNQHSHNTCTCYVIDMFEGGVKHDKNNPDHISSDAIVSIYILNKKIALKFLLIYILIF